MVSQQVIKPLLLLSFLGFCLAGCDSNSGYDYDNGYEQGLQDAAMYDEGHHDGYNEKRCTYPNDPDYVDGYTNEKKRR